MEINKIMKVLMINGSPRPNGNTALALSEIAKQLGKNGIGSEIVWIGNKPVRTTCPSCLRQPESYLPPAVTARKEPLRTLSGN